MRALSQKREDENLCIEAPVGTGRSDFREVSYAEISLQPLCSRIDNVWQAVRQNHPAEPLQPTHGPLQQADLRNCEEPLEAKRMRRPEVHPDGDELLAREEGEAALVSPRGTCLVRRIDNKGSSRENDGDLRTLPGT